MSAPSGTRLTSGSTPGRSERRERSRRRRLIAPAVVTVVVLAVAVLASFLWTSHYIHTATSDLQTSPVTPVPSGQGGGAGANRASLLAEVHGAVWAVSTLDGNGNPSVGSAFAVVSTSAQTLLLTSYGVVAAATYQTPPPIQVRQGNGADQSVTLRSWDAVHDLALLVMDKGNEPVLHGTSGVPPTLGQQVFQVSGAGGPTGAIVAGKLTSVSAGTLEEDTAPVITSRGGPLIDANGDVLGVVASSTYLPPQPAASPAGHAMVPVQDACSRVLVCPGGTFP